MPERGQRNASAGMPEAIASSCTMPKASLLRSEGNTNRLMSRARQAAQETAGNRSPCALKDYGKLLEDPMAADVTFVVDGQRVTVAF